MVAPIPLTRSSARRAPWRNRLAGLAVALAVHLVALAMAIPYVAADRPAPDDTPILYLNVTRAPVLPRPEPRVAPPSPSPPLAKAPAPARADPPAPPAVQAPPSAPPAPPTAPSPAPEAPPPSPPPPPPPAVAMAPPPAAPVPAAPSSPPLLDPTSPFQAEVLAQLALARRYPPTARSLRQEGVATVRFRMLRSGSVIQSAVVKSSGWGALDEEALALLRRVRLPPIPDGLPAVLDLEVNLEYRLK